MEYCPFFGRLQQFLDGVLDAKVSTQMDDHIESCPICQRRLEVLTQTAPPGNAPDGLQGSTPVLTPTLKSNFVQRILHDPELLRKSPLSPKTGTTPEACELPAQIGNYEIIREIGRGGMGIVYEARQATLDRIVALKVLPHQRFSSETSAARFRREARSASQLHHTNIVPIFEFGEDDGIQFFTMQLIRGRSLSQIASIVPTSIGQKSTNSDPNSTIDAANGTAELSPRLRYDAESSDAANTNGLSVKAIPDLAWFPMVAEVGRQVASALAHAHERGVVHRDVKPSNILLDGQGIAWLADFGLAKQGDDDLTTSLEAPGTFRFMAPERFRGTSNERSDIYSLGATLYEVLAGRPAFREKDHVALMHQIQRTGPATLRSIDPTIPRDLQTIVAKAMSKDPLRRYSTASGMAEDLRRYLNGEPIRARRVGRLERLWLWAKMRKALAAALAVLVLFVVGTAIGSTLAAFHFRSQSNAISDLSIEKDIALADALRAATTSRAVTEFLQRDLLEMANPANQENGQRDPDITMLELLALSEKRIGQRFADKPLVEANIRQTIGSTYRHVGRYRDALSQLEIAYHLFDSELGESHGDTLSARHELAWALYCVGDVDTAEVVFRKTHEMRAYHLGRHAPETLVSQCDLGYLLRTKNEYAEAEKLLSEALPIQSGLLGNEHSDVMQTAYQLAEVYRQRNRLSEAAGLHQQILESRTKILGSDHVDTFASRAALGWTFLEQQLFDKAESTFQSLVVDKTRCLGPNHPSTLNSVLGLGVTYIHQEKYDLAEVQFRRDLVARTATLGADHPDALVAKARLAQAYYYQRKLGEAELLYQDYLSRPSTKRKIGNKHQRRYFAQLSDLYERTERYALAEPYLRTLVNYLQTDPGSIDEYVQTVFALARNLMQQRKWSEAERVLHPCYERLNTMPPRTWAHHYCQYLVGKCLALQDRYEDAESWLLEASSAMLKLDLDDADRGDTVEDSLLWLVKTLNENGKETEASSWKAKLNK